MKNNQLKQWLFNKPILFTFIFVGLGLIFSVIHSIISMFVPIESSAPLAIMFILSFIFSVYYTIKKLPHDKMYRNDFVAIVNGGAFISIIFSLLILFVPHGPDAQTQALWLYATHPAIVITGMTALIFSGLYLSGIAISGIYAKYKRCREMGISPWKIILSMPFAFFMLWTPGYLLAEKSNKSNLQIKSAWYSKLNKWILNDFNNTLLVFLLILLFKTSFAGVSTMLLTLSLLVIYTLWYIKHKSDFVKNINNGYALTAVGINIAIIMAVLSLLI